VAGATGATGRVLVPMARELGFDVRAHVRPSTAATGEGLGRESFAHVADLEDTAAMVAALSGREVVVSLVGTMRKRFATGDTYASSDVGTARSLVAAARTAGVGRFLLLSSLGAGGLGAYSYAKGQAEDIVHGSGLRWTIFRPSALVSPPGDAGRHGPREVPKLVFSFAALVGAIPGLRDLADDLGPMPIVTLARAMLHVCAEPRDGQVLAGRDILALA
jgi:uncharacterized protein YbjT (DUF2867 family)